MGYTEEELALELYRHFDDLERYAAGVAEDSAALYAETEVQIRDLIYRISGEKIGNDYKSAQKLEELQKRIAEIRYNVAEKIENLLKEQKRELVLAEIAFWMMFFGAAFNRNGKALSIEEMKQIEKYGKYHGLTQKQIIEKVLAGDVNRIYESIVSGITGKKSVSDIVVDIQRQSDVTRRYIKTEVNAIVDGIVNDTELALGAKNRCSLIFCTMLDGNVCEDCSSHEGEVYSYDDPDIPAIPLHVQCRCHFVPFYES